MQLHNLVKPIEEMTDDELRAHLLSLRSRREVEKPVAKAKAKKAEKKQSNKKVSEVEKLLASLDPAQLELLLKGMSE